MLRLNVFKTIHQFGFHSSQNGSPVQNYLFESFSIKRHESFEISCAKFRNKELTATSVTILNPPNLNSKIPTKPTKTPSFFKRTNNSAAFFVGFGIRKMRPKWQFPSHILQVAASACQHFSIRNTASNAGFSIVMLGFRCVDYLPSVNQGLVAIDINTYSRRQGAHSPEVGKLKWGSIEPFCNFYHRNPRSWGVNQQKHQKVQSYFFPFRICFVSFLLSGHNFLSQTQKKTTSAHHLRWV